MARRGFLRSEFSYVYSNFRFHKILNCCWRSRLIAKYYRGEKKGVLAEIARYDKYQLTYWDFTLCTVILCLLTGYLKKWGLHNHTILEGFICFPLPSKSTYSPISSQTQSGDQHWKDIQASVTEWGEDSLDPSDGGKEAAAGVPALFGLQGCHHVTQTRFQNRETWMSPQGTPASHLKRWWLLWGPSALNFEPSTAPFRGSSRFPLDRVAGNALLQTTRENMPANGTGQKVRKKEGNS